MKRLLIVLGIAFLTCRPLYLGAQEVNVSGDQEYEPLQKVQPLYPSVSQWNGIEGWCIVTYTVTAEGKTRDPYPDSCSPAGLFEAVSITAAREFRYKPRIVSGVAVDVAGVQNKFTFELRGGGKRFEVGPNPIKFSRIKKTRLSSIEKRIQRKDWEGLRKYSLGRVRGNFRLLYFAGYAELMMGNDDAAYKLIEQFIFESKEKPPFEYVTFGALQLLIPHYYQTNQYEKLLDIESRIDIWLFRLIDAQEVNRMALMIADAYGVRGQGVESNKRFQQIIDRAEVGTADSYVTMARQVLGQ